MVTTILTPIIGFGENEDAREGTLDYTNNIRPTVNFLNGVDSEFSFYFYVPAELSGTITDTEVKFGIISETANSDCIFQVRHSYIADAESPKNPTFTDSSEQTITMPAADTRKDVTAFNLSTDPAKGVLVVLMIKRHGADANDDHTDLVHLLLETLRMVITH